VNLLAISYLNIGPFKDTPLSCFFDQGKYLIKAPIGSGKSFLFFDGPLFGLYKIANRNMLNAQSKEGRIKIFFELDEEKYLVIRNLKAGKSKDSCSSLLYKISIDQEKFWQIKNEQGYAILEKNIDIEKFLRNNGASFEEISFKNETDLQQTLQSMLAPKEVFLNTSFLMQDSENIFQLTPADRLNVLKNVFNLLAIDEGKEIIADKKREVGYKLKATADTSKYDTKLQNLLNRYTENFSTLLTYKDYADLGNIIEKKEYQDFLDDIELIREKVTITDFSLENLPRDLVETLQ
jgi:DNA repair exonuclease SbcCD ATPase subunit